MKKNAPFFSNLEKRINNFIEKPISVDISFSNGVRVTLAGYTKKTYRVEFINTETSNVEYSTYLKPGFFAAPNKRYFVKWKVNVYENEKLLRTSEVDLKNKIVHVQLDSSSLGDNLAWMPQALRFSEINECKLILTTFYNDLFKKKYPQIIWNDPGSVIPPHNYSYCIGYHYDDELYNKTPIDPRTVPLAKVACDILRIPYEETRPEIDYEVSKTCPLEDPYVCIATHSTAGAKFWHRENGWQDVVDYLNERGYKVAVIQKEPTDLKNIIDWTGEMSLRDRMNQLHWAKFFIGIGSGLSWLAWAVKKPVVLISGFSDAFSEFQLDCERIINKQVCNSCWNDTNFQFDKGDWWWCPYHKGTDRYFECTRQIKSEEVIQRIENTILKEKN